MYGVIGHVDDERVDWYKLNDGSVVSFHVAFLDEAREESVIIVSDSETWPSVTAARLGIEYTFMRSAEPEEVDRFMNALGVGFGDEEE